MKKETREFIDELIKLKQDKIDNGPIDITADQLWKYSGEIEEYTNGYKELVNEYKIFKAKIYIKENSTLRIKEYHKELKRDKIQKYAKSYG